MNSTPNNTSSLVNSENLEFERQRLNAEKEILANIEEFAWLFEKIRKSKNSEEFQKIISENSEASNDSKYETKNTESKIDNYEQEESKEEDRDSNVDNQSDTWEKENNSSKISLWINNESEDSQNNEDNNEDESKEESQNDNENSQDTEEPSAPKIKLNL